MTPSMAVGRLVQIPEMTDALDPDGTYVYADKATQEQLRVKMRREAIAKRASLTTLTLSQKMVVDIAWGYKEAIRLFKLYPEVVCCDVTEDTNNERRPLMTFSIRESHGKQLVFLYVLLPDEKACSFWWVFQSVLPTLLHKENLKRINVIITDGNSQETTQIDHMRDRVEQMRHTMASAFHDSNGQFRRLLRV